MSGARFQALCAERAVRISLRTAVRINCLSLLAAVVSPMGVVGDGLRTHMLVKKHRAQLADSIGVVILDRMAGLIASVVVAVVSLAFAGDAPRTAPIRLVLWIVSAGVVGVIVLLFLVGRTARRLGPRRPRGRWATRLAKLEVLDGTELRSKRGIVTSLAGQCTNRAIVLDLSPHCRSIGPVQRVAGVASDPARPGAWQGHYVEVEPGCSVDELNEELARRGERLFFAPDPATCC